MSRVRFEDVEDKDNDRMTLRMLEKSPEVLRGVWVYYGYHTQLIFKDGERFALNWKSQNPCYLQNKHLRAEWAQVLGIPSVEVERYVRRIKEKQKLVAKARKIDHAKDILLNSGYKVEAP